MLLCSAAMNRRFYVLCRCPGAGVDSPRAQQRSPISRRSSTPFRRTSGPHQRSPAPLLRRGSAEARLQRLPNLKHLSVRQASSPGRPDLAISLLQSLPLTMRTLLYDYSGGTRGRMLAWHMVASNMLPHMRLIHLDWSGDEDDTRHVPVAGSPLHAMVASV